MYKWEIGKNTIKNLDVSPLWLIVSLVSAGIVFYIFALYMYWVRF